MSKKTDTPLSPATRLVQGGRRREWAAIPGEPGSIVNPPVWRASTILFDDVAHLRAADGDSHHHLYYGRRSTPTGWSLAEAITEMEPEAGGTALFPSGVAAITTALLAMLRPGDDLLMVDSAYGPSRVFCDGLMTCTSHPDAAKLVAMSPPMMPPPMIATQSLPIAVPRSDPSLRAIICRRRRRSRRMGVARGTL